MGKILLVTPPFLQPNSPYPATAYLKSYLARHGHRAEQYDLSVELLGEIFSKTFLERVFTAYAEHKSARGGRRSAMRPMLISNVSMHCAANIPLR